MYLRFGLCSLGTDYLQEIFGDLDYLLASLYFNPETKSRKKVTWSPGHTTQTSVSIGSPDPGSILCTPELQWGLPPCGGHLEEGRCPRFNIRHMPPPRGPFCLYSRSLQGSPPALLSRPATSSSRKCRRWHPESGERVPSKMLASSTGRYFTGVSGSGAKLSQPCHTCPGRASAIRAG